MSEHAQSAVTFGGFAEAWATTKLHRRHSAQVEARLRRHVYPRLGLRPLHLITPGEVKEVVKSLSDDGLAASTIDAIHSCMASVFRAAVADGIITDSPCRGVMLPRVDRAKLVPLTDEAVTALIDAMPPRYRAAVILASATGLRQGECFGLTADRVDFDRRTLRVDQQLVLHRGGSSQQSPLQPLRSQRTVPLGAVAIDALEAHMEAYGSGLWGLIFTDDRGGPIRGTRFNTIWRRAVEEAGLPVGTHVHDLRHYFASVLVRSGLPICEVQRMLGHASARVTLDTYGDLFP